jgi:hypothetical protein
MIDRSGKAAVAVDVPIKAASSPGRPRKIRATGLGTRPHRRSLPRASIGLPVVSADADGISITASDGETRHIGAGEIVLVEDTTGKSHITKSSGDKPHHTIFLPID